MSGATRFDKMKNRLDLIPPEAMWEVGMIYTYGAYIKYADHNYRKGLPWSGTFAGIMRHLWKFWWGEDYDKESGVSHLACAIWGCMTLITHMYHNRELDDRVFEHFNTPKEGYGTGAAYDIDTISLNMFKQWERTKEELAAKGQTMEDNNENSI